MINLSKTHPPSLHEPLQSSRDNVEELFPDVETIVVNPQHLEQLVVFEVRASERVCGDRAYSIDWF